MLMITLCLPFMVITSCKKGKNNPDSCNGSSTRRNVKILIDELATTIDTVNIIDISVDSIGGLAVPEVNKESARQDVEKKVFRITAKVHKVSKHRDGDIKIKLTNGNDVYINCEAPNMGCTYIQSSSFFNRMERARNWIEPRYDELEGKTVTITGVGFIDIDHRYPRNAAKNEMELHPILDISF
jgi:hypothetical protein